jgi:predicted PurR-regulated permease PerM
MFDTFWDAKTARILFTALMIAVILAFLYGARQTLTLFLFAVLFAYLVDPLVSYLEKPLRGRTQAIGAVYLLLIGLLVGVGFVIGPKIADEGRSLATSLPSLIDRIGSGQLVFQIGQTHGWSQQREAQIQSFFVAHRNDILNYAKSIGESLAEPAQHIWWLILIPILSLFFLKDGQAIADNLIELARTPEETTMVQGIVRDVNVMLGSYIRAQLILSVFTAVAYTVVLSLMNVSYAFILGPIAGIFEFVPTVGPAIAAVGIFAIAALTSYPHLAWLVVFLGAWRLIQDYVNSPRVMGKSLEISPLAQLFAVLAGGEIGGVVGALISVPAVAGLRILWRRMSKYKPAEEQPSASLFKSDRFRRFITRPQRGGAPAAAIEIPESDQP